MKTCIGSLLLLLALSACGAKTTVVLVPDDNGHVGTVDITASNDKLTLKGADEFVSVSKKISTPKIMDQATIAKNFGQALAAAPQKPESFLLYFGSESADPDQASLKLIPAIVGEIKGRPVARVSIIGHTDNTGDRPYNERLSQSRAATVRKLLLRAGADADVLSVRGFGPNDPLVPTAPGVHEPKNRRVEVLVR